MTTKPIRAEDPEDEEDEVDNSDLDEQMAFNKFVDDWRSGCQSIPEDDM